MNPFELTVTLYLWVAILMMVIIFIAAFVVGWAWGYERGDRRYR